MGTRFYIDGKLVGDVTSIEMTTNKLTLEDAINIASQAHRNQKDKGGNPYILHCLRVMLQMETEESMIIAVLHDVVEDTGWDWRGLMEAGANGKIVHTIGLLTRLRGYMPSSKNPTFANETYREYIYKIANSRSPVAIKVKMADLRDNLNLNRLPIDEIGTFKSLIEREKWALQYLENVV